MAWLKRFANRQNEWRKLKHLRLPPPDYSTLRLAQRLDEQNRRINHMWRQS